MTTKTTTTTTATSEETEEAVAMDDALDLNLNRLSLQKEDESSSSSAELALLTSRELFGGAIKASIPNLWRDVSQVRQVPDHQEVYQDCTFQCGSSGSGSSNTVKTPDVGTLTGMGTLMGTGGCVIIEILEWQEDVTDDDAAKYYFNDLTEANGNSNDNDNGRIMYQNVWDIGYNPEQQKQQTQDAEKKINGNNLMPRLSARVKACSCIGLQSIAPLANKTELEEGKASMVKVELCVVRLEAIQTDLLITLSMPAADVDVDVDDNDNDNGDGDGETKSDGKVVHTTYEKHGDLFLGILQSVEVEDWSLFLAG